MTDIPILDDEYWKALEILAEEVGCVKECGVQKLPWFPANGDRFEWAMKTYQNRHQDDPTHHFLTFPWPEPGEVPDIPIRHFVPTEKERAKIQ